MSELNIQIGDYVLVSRDQKLKVVQVIGFDNFLHEFKGSDNRLIFTNFSRNLKRVVKGLGSYPHCHVVRKIKPKNTNIMPQVEV